MCADTYTREELERCSLFCLTDFKGPKEIFVGLRDRAMLLLSTSTALRGGSCRGVELSDLFPSTIPSPDGEGSGIEVSCFTTIAVVRTLRIIGTRHPPGQCKTQPDGPCG